jgi:hypothetical protein
VDDQCKGRALVKLCCAGNRSTQQHPRPEDP